MPCTGKTTLVRKILNSVDDPKFFKYGQLRGYISDNLAILGVYTPNEVFSGTDKLSLSVQKSYENFLKITDYDVLFEGDRLFTAKNLEDIQKNYDYQFYVLELPDDLLEERRIGRNNTQSDKFLKGRATKINNIKSNEALKENIKLVEMIGEKELNETMNNIKDFLI